MLKLLSNFHLEMGGETTKFNFVENQKLNSLVVYEKY